MNVISGEVTGISVDSGADAPRWALHTSDRTVLADGVMITGPGQPERSILPGNPRVLSIAQFWHRAARNELLRRACRGDRGRRDRCVDAQ